MKKIEAIIRREKLNTVKEKLQILGINAMTVIPIHGMGEEQGYTETYRGEQHAIDFLPRLKIEIIVADDYVEMCVAAIAETARSGKVGDGRILVIAVDQFINIRTGEVQLSEVAQA